MCFIHTLRYWPKPSYEKNPGCQMLPMLHSRWGGKICWTNKEPKPPKRQRLRWKENTLVASPFTHPALRGFFEMVGLLFLLHCWWFLSFLVFQGRVGLKFKGSGGKRDKVLLGTHSTLLANVQSYLFQWTNGNTVGNGCSNSFTSFFKVIIWFPK